MATNYPAGIDAFSNPGGNDSLNNANPALAHSVQHTQLNQAVIALETVVGVTGSTDTNSLVYKVAHGTGGGGGGSTSNLIVVGGRGETQLQTLLGSNASASADGTGVIMTADTVIPGLSISDVIPNSGITIALEWHNPTGTADGTTIGIGKLGQELTNCVQLSYQTDANTVVYNRIGGVTSGTGTAVSYGNPADANVHHMMLVIYPIDTTHVYAVATIDSPAHQVTGTVASPNLMYSGSNPLSGWIAQNSRIVVTSLCVRYEAVL